ncbi:bifunctional DNA primase/polymerase [Leucobacter salsicius]|uniref:bifunctional DNA primase/polymerase n=1 Tax=Leucobacter salsicius TaxID=664638 RepID=UPI0009FC75FC
MMSYLEVALHNATHGWPVFPVQPDKRPLRGWTKWEEKATTSTVVIREWWTQNPHALPAVTPGRVNKTCIDVDRKPGKPDGWESLIDRRVRISPVTFRGSSLSGVGLHLWFRDLSSSVNGLLPGVDRKSRGGYVVTPYALPMVTQVQTRLPAALQGGKTKIMTTSVPYLGETADWFHGYLGLTPSQGVQQVLRRFEGEGSESFIGHESMLRVQTHLVLLAADGHGGVPEALDRLATIWVNTPHTGDEDPALEWYLALQGAISKHGGTQSWR